MQSNSSGAGGWHIPCECGFVVVSATRESECPKCHRLLSVAAWGGDPVNVSARANAPHATSGDGERVGALRA